MTGTPSAAAKTWGPFNGRQLTVMFVAVAVVCFPSAAWAVDTFSNVAIQDPVSGAKAAVDSSRRLQVNGSVSGSSVYALPRPPATPWSFAGSAHGRALLTPLIAGPSTAPINLTSVSIGTHDADVIFLLFAYSVPSTATTCDETTWLASPYFLMGAANTVAMSASFPTPIVIRPPAGRKACLYARNDVEGGIVRLNASGYYGA